MTKKSGAAFAKKTDAAKKHHTLAGINHTSESKIMGESGSYKMKEVPFVTLQKVALTYASTGPCVISFRAKRTHVRFFVALIVIYIFRPLLQPDKSETMPLRAQ
ncbi:hypothetical protein AAGS40_20470 [Paraburkholderia sp. PREW-6R]|uniref:hypothetical protein n=1 Tax=Paraburkholderia sp. PREW-6R TaxID=3141544 RepID=UPI0031F4D3D6